MGRSPPCAPIVLVTAYNVNTQEWDMSNSEACPITIHLPLPTPFAGVREETEPPVKNRTNLELNLQVPRIKDALFDKKIS